MFGDGVCLWLVALLPCWWCVIGVCFEEVVFDVISWDVCMYAAWMPQAASSCTW
jgi:hypothetical protein